MRVKLDFNNSIDYAGEPEYQLGVWDCLIPANLYHATSKQNKESILEHGLLVGHSGKTVLPMFMSKEYSQYIYLDPDKYSALSFVGDKDDSVVFKVSTKNLDPTLFEVDQNNSYNYEIVQELLDACEDNSCKIKEMLVICSSITLQYKGDIPREALKIVIGK